MADDEYVFKLVLIGDKMVGKTSIIRQFVHGSFEGRYLGTIGLNVSTKNLIIDDTKVSLNIFDIEAEASFEQLFAPFASGSSGALVVFDLSRAETLESVNDWVNRLMAVKNSSSAENLILIGNKSDLVNQRQIKKSEGELTCKKHNMIAYAETSAKKNEYIQEAFEILAKRFLEQALNI
ncbi:MAG: Rab family GTPase [Candidatus Hodarchaeales archaeon]|jgi:small GTP-binding protein